MVWTVEHNEGCISNPLPSSTMVRKASTVSSNQSDAAQMPKHSRSTFTCLFLAPLLQVSMATELLCLSTLLLHLCFSISLDCDLAMQNAAITDAQYGHPEV